MTETEAQEIPIPRSEIDAVRGELFAWVSLQDDGNTFDLGMRIYCNLELDDPPLPIIASQVERLAALLGRKAKM